jgi:hypothetical protein
VTAEFTKAKELKKSYSVKGDGQSSRVYTPVEAGWDLTTLVEYLTPSGSIGATLAQVGSLDAPRWRLDFAFDCQGIHSNLTEDTIADYLGILQQGFRELIYYENLTVHLSAWRDDRNRQVELSERAKQCRSPYLRSLIVSDKLKAQELTQKGIRKPKQMILWVTYTFRGKFRQQDRLAAAINKVVDGFRKFTGEYYISKQLDLENFLDAGYKKGFSCWKNILQNKFKLQLRPLSVDGVWEQLWLRFNRHNCNAAMPPPPQKLIYDISSKQLSEEVNNNLDPRTILVIHDVAIPVAERDCLKHNGKYLGVLHLANKPQSFESPSDQLNYFWQILARDDVWDVEIFTQVITNNQDLARKNLQDLAKESKTELEFFESKGSLSIQSEFNLEQSLEAQRSIIAGNNLIHNVACVMVVHRDDREELNFDCQSLSSMFLYPAVLLREANHPWFSWMQTLPASWSPLQSDPRDRRIELDSSEALGFLPLVKTRDVDFGGVEFVAENSGTPIYLDLVRNCRHLKIFGTTRAGKTVLASGFIAHFLAANLPVSIMDFPTTEAASSFKSFVQVLNGSYFDTISQACNPFEVPRLKRFGDSEREDRRTQYVAFLRELLKIMVLGIDSNLSQINPEIIGSILGRLIEAFFKDPQITDRYEVATKGGLGSDAWQQYPTLKDFLPFCSIERLGLTKASDELLNHLEYIHLRLSDWLENSPLKRSFNQPSTISTDANLFAMALRGISANTEGAVLAMLMNSVVLRRALENPTSLIFIDECSVLFKISALSEYIGTLCATGLKAGMVVILSAQEPMSIAQSAGGDLIFANCTTTLTGFVAKETAPDFCELLGLEEEEIIPNTLENYRTQPGRPYANFLHSRDGIHTPVRFYASDLLFNLMGNNPEERAERESRMSEFGGDIARYLQAELQKTKMR